MKYIYLYFIFGLLACSVNEDVKEQDQSNRKTSEHDKLDTEKLNFFPVIGEDATDNYGEPLQFNDVLPSEYVVDDLTDKLQKSNDEFEAFAIPNEKELLEGDSVQLKLD